MLLAVAGDTSMLTLEANPRSPASVPRGRHSSGVVWRCGARYSDVNVRDARGSETNYDDRREA